MTMVKKPEIPLGDADVVRRLCEMDESIRFEFKRVSNRMPQKGLEAIVAFANTEGGFLILGMEDFKKAQGSDRLYGVQENPEAVDELRQLIAHRITPPIMHVEWKILSCTLRDGSSGTIVIVVVQKSPGIHSIVEGGTWKRLERSNRQMTAAEINELSYARGVISAESELTDIPFNCWTRRPGLAIATPEN